MSRATEWLWQSRALADAEALIAQETPEHRARREECRAFHDAAGQLSVSGARAAEALDLLHQKGLEVSQETQALPAWLADAHAIVLRRLEEPQRARTAALQNRLYRASGVALALLLLAWLVEPSAAKRFSDPDLLAGRAWKLPNDGSLAIEYDLGEPLALSRLRLKNRQDSNPERTVPLLVEVSDDGKSWKQVARRDAVFSEWSVGFPTVTARYFRLRAEQPWLLHFEKIELRR